MAIRASGAHSPPPSTKGKATVPRKWWSYAKARKYAKLQPPKKKNPVRVYYQAPTKGAKMQETSTPQPGPDAPPQPDPTPPDDGDEDE